MTGIIFFIGNDLFSFLCSLYNSYRSVERDEDVLVEHELFDTERKSQRKYYAEPIVSHITMQFANLIWCGSTFLYPNCKKCQNNKATAIYISWKVRGFILLQDLHALIHMILLCLVKKSIIWQNPETSLVSNITVSSFDANL